MAQRNRHRDVRARSGALYTRDFGHGETIALIHAFPLNGRMWQPQIEALTGRFRLIAPDLAGFGLSAAPATPLFFADHARSVLETINLNIPEAGHLPNLESPELFNDCMIRLVAECAPA